MAVYLTPDGVEIKPGDFGLVQISGEVGRLIRIGQFLNGDGYANFEHAFIYLGDGLIMEAEPGGARIANLSEYDGRSIRWSSGLINLTDQQRNDIVRIARSFEGVPYSAADYFALAAHRFHIWVPGLRHHIESSKCVICSQLVDRVYDLAGVHLFTDKRWDGYVTPGMLDELLDRLKSAKT